MSDSPTAPALTAHYATELDSIRAQGLFKSERIITSPQSAEIELADGRTVLNFCANNYLGPGRPSGHHPGRQGRAGYAWLRHGQRAFHLRHPGPAQAAGSKDRGFLRYRGHHPLCRLLRCQRRPVRALAGRGRCDHFRCAQPCLDHRRRAPVQGQAFPLRQLRHGRPGSAAAGRRGGRMQDQADHHRRRVLDGWLHRATG